MKERYRLFLRRKSVYYAFDNTTKTFESLKTKDKAEAERLLMALNEAGKQPAMNLGLARVYLKHSDPMVSQRTWQHVLDEIIKLKSGPTQYRWQSAAKDKAFDLIRNRLLIETQAEHFLEVLKKGTVSTNAYLRKTHNFALDMNWLPATVIPRRQWPAIHFKEKRAITLAEHQRIIAAEVNPERKIFYQLCWHLGASQGDIAALKGEDVDWANNTVSFFRKKTGVPVLVHLGSDALNLLKDLPSEGPLFPYLSTRARRRPRHRVQAALPAVEDSGRDAAQLPLRVGRARQDRRLSRALRPGGPGAQLQGRASRLRQARPGEDSLPGRIREKGRGSGLGPGVSLALRAGHSAPAGLGTHRAPCPAACGWHPGHASP